MLRLRQVAREARRDRHVAVQQVEAFPCSKMVDDPAPLAQERGIG